MEDEFQDFYTFENSSEVDFDYEFDVVKYFDFTRPETADEIEESEKWFQCGIGYPPSPLLVKLNRGFTKLGKSETSSRKYGHQKTCSISNASNSRGVSEISFIKQGEHNVKSIPKSLSHTFLSRSSRLLKPTASHLAKQNRQLSVPSTKINERLNKLGSSLKSPGELVATKRQKLEIGYLRKVAHLKHQVSFSHKSTKRVDTGDAKSYTRPKVTIPKEPNLKTAHRAQRHRFKNTVESESSPKSDSCSSVASLQERTNTFCKFNGQSFNKKLSSQILSSKGDIGVSKNNKRETNVSKEFKLCVNKKPSQSPPTELFNKMSLNTKYHRNSLHEKKQPFHLEGLKKNVSSPIMKENKVPNIATEISKRCCPKQNQFGRERIITDIGNILNNTRNILIY